jgi:hypothetical protein
MAELVIFQGMTVVRRENRTGKESVGMKEVLERSRR